MALINCGSLQIKCMVFNCWITFNFYTLQGHLNYAILFFPMLLLYFLLIMSDNFSGVVGELRKADGMQKRVDGVP